VAFADDFLNIPWDDVQQPFVGDFIPTVSTLGSMALIAKNGQPITYNRFERYAGAKGYFRGWFIDH
jgi:hypothetical protein